MHYYYQKYPYLHYSYWDTDGSYVMFSIPPELLAMAFTFKFGYAPKTFFDCGAATGEIVLRALRAGMDARGIDIKIYPKQPSKGDFDCGVASQEMAYSIKNIKNRINASARNGVELSDLFDSGRIQIKSIMDCKPITADLAYCNGTLTYFTEQQLPRVLKKFRNCKMLCAIHNTTEDVNAAREMGYELTTCNRPRLIQPRDWWIETLSKNGFDTEYNPYLRCFHAIPKCRR